MINEDRVRKMTRIAIREERAGYRIQTADGLDQKHFVSYYGVRSFFFGTILYFIVFAILAAAAFSVFVIPVTRLTVAGLVFGGILGYLFFLLGYIRYERHRNIARYEEYRRTVREQQEDMKELAALYEAEDKESHKESK